MGVPTKPGFYWRRSLDEFGLVVERVVEVDTLVSTSPEELFYWVAGELGATFVQETYGVEWSDQLPNPWRQ